eukprot:11182083-Lingulodinium_polyedra.AAC.1
MSVCASVHASCACPIRRPSAPAPRGRRRSQMQKKTNDINAEMDRSGINGSHGNQVGSSRHAINL